MKKKNPWAWIPTLYFTEGLPYVAVMNISGIMYKNLEISNTDIALYTSWLYLPWVIKPLWSPFVDLLKSKRWWIVVMQFLIGAGMAGVAFTIPTNFFFQATLAFFWLIAFSSATHDIAADGFYLLELNQDQQAFFIGIRNTFYRLAMIFGQGTLIIFAGWMEKETGNIPLSWTYLFFIMAGILVAMAIYHRLILPKPLPDIDQTKKSVKKILSEFVETLKDFFSKKGVAASLFFILTYRLGEAQLLKLASPFLLDKRVNGGLELATEKVGIVYGIVGLIALMTGGILGGLTISKGGLKKWIWPMALALTLPSFAYIYLAYTQPDNFLIINLSIAIEQFGYGFGFTAFTMHMMLFSEGKYKTSHFAFCTGFMALGMMLPGMISGWIQEQIGYLNFFIWVILCSIPGLIAVRLLNIKE